ncbi:uncharacterized protein B0T15DRAFT_527401 [Chaetomium strumarium]|uniref:Uncharacterized protein n=1 Tax=Chaetomium strumarium TaxID=1170767 RepID=A0AAJ0GUV7_9PEZI|nr:hypothetical protein B0T15DRAFT_527401 [Chaetomium strumarium]
MSAPSAPSGNPQNPLSQDQTGQQQAHQQQQQQQQQQQNVGLWTGHAEWIKGAAESTIGSIIGAESWKTAGEQEKARARECMQAAAQQRDPTKAGYGRAEEIAGKLTGCEGMKHEGAASKTAGANKRRD